MKAIGQRWATFLAALTPGFVVMVSSPVMAQYTTAQLSGIVTDKQRRIYPNYGTIDFLDSEVNSNYNGLQLTLEKRFSRGFSFLANYTWAKALDDFGPGGSAVHQSPNGSKFSGNYLMPRIAINNFAGRLVNGWGLSDIATWQTGFPYTFYSDTDNSFTAIGSDRADLTIPNIRGAKLSTGRSHPQLVNAWFNTSAFTTNAIGTFGNSGKNVLRGPRYFDTDLAAIKNTDLEKGVSLQFRAEFYNALNNVNFGMPDSGLTDSFFGQLTYAQSPRILQFSLKVLF